MDPPVLEDADVLTGPKFWGSSASIKGHLPFLLHSPIEPRPWRCSPGLSLSLLLHSPSNLARGGALQVSLPLPLAMDTFFLSHGSPTMSIDEKVPMRHFLKSWRAKVLREAPRAILLVSAHWDTADPAVNVVDRHDTIHDFYGFPKAMYQIKYPAPGAPELARRVKELLAAAGFRGVQEDKKRGLDHGAWVPLMLMYPEADVPVCQLSVQSSRDGAHHYLLGRALAPLREEGVLIVGSGSATHNLRALDRDSDQAPTWALDFTAWLKDSLLNGRHEDVQHYEHKAPCAKIAHPWPEHFYPLHVALGAAGASAKAELIHDSWTNGSLSYASYRFTTPS